MGTTFLLTAFQLFTYTEGVRIKTRGGLGKYRKIYKRDLGVTTTVKRNVMSYSCLQPEDKDLLDHILYQKEKFNIYESLSGLVDEEWLKYIKLKEHLDGIFRPITFL